MKKDQKEVIAKKGLVILHIGDGKGKTTAAIGLAARASGAGLAVYILQFVKAKPKDKRESGEWPVSSEINFFESISPNGKLGRVVCDQAGAGFVGILGDRKEKIAHQKAALDGLSLAREQMFSGKFQMIVLDEILSAVELDLLTEQDLLDLIFAKPKDLHLVITGHKRFKKLIEAADLVTEMKLIKHPYYEGVLAQKGVDY